MIKRTYNYEPDNRDINGGLLSYKFDAMDIVSRDANDNPTQVDFYQNSIGEADSKLAMTLYITYDINGNKKTIEVEDHITIYDSRWNQ